MKNRTRRSLSGAVCAVAVTSLAHQALAQTEGNEIASTGVAPGDDAYAYGATDPRPSAFDDSRSPPRVIAADDPTQDEIQADEDSETDKREPTKRFVHGFRIGYLHLMNSDLPTDTPDAECPNCSLEERHDLKTPHQFLIGYELMGRIVGHDMLNVILVANATVSGLEQSRFLPSANALVGFELNNSLQVGVGMNLTAEKEKPVHMIGAVGWTPEVGSFNVPIHFFFIPDVDHNHRFGTTVGVNW